MTRVMGVEFGLVGALEIAAEEATFAATRTGDRVERVRLRKLAEMLYAEARGLESMGGVKNG